KADVQSFVLCMRPPVPRDCEGKTAIDKQRKQNCNETSKDEEKRRIGNVGHASLRVLHAHKILRAKEIARTVKKIDASGNRMALLYIVLPRSHSLGNGVSLSGHRGVLHLHLRALMQGLIYCAVMLLPKSIASLPDNMQCPHVSPCVLCCRPYNRSI